MTDDHLPLTPEELQAVLREIRRQFDNVDANRRSRRTHTHIAAIQREIELSRKLEDMKLAPDQEQVLFSLLTLPPEGIDLLRDLLKQEH
jgi:hypothetical protein